MYNRLISLPESGDRSFFLWGARQTGKSTLLRSRFPDALYVDLLKSEEFARYLQAPQLLRSELEGHDPGRLIIIDEVQKVPSLLDEVHWLIENRRLQFALCGSSARKLKRGHANLLGGRALRYELYGLTAQELGRDFDLDRMINRGYLPEHLQCEEKFWKRSMLSYVGDYLKEEIAAEGLVRNLSGFADFLNVAALSDTEPVSYSSFARDVGVSANTIKDYFSILVDTLQGWLVPAFSKRPKRRVTLAPKFYFADVGTVNHLAKRGHILRKSELFGKAFENWVAHEIRAYNQYCDRFLEIAYWRLSTGVEVDFIIGDMHCAIEVKASDRPRDDHLHNLRELVKDHPEIKHRVLVNLEEKRRKTVDGIEIVPAHEFVRGLWSNAWF